MKAGSQCHIERSEGEGVAPATAWRRECIHCRAALLLLLPSLLVAAACYGEMRADGNLPGRLWSSLAAEKTAS